MTPETPDAFEQQATEAIVGDPSLRDELTDDEAQPLINWGLAQVRTLAQQAASQPADTAPMDDTMRDLRKLMKRINRWVGYRASGETDRMSKGLNRLARISSKIYPNTTPPDAAQLDAFMAEQVNLSTGEVITRLLAMFGPPWDPRPPLDAPEEHEKLAAPPKFEQLTAPPKPEQLAGPDAPDLLAPGEGTTTHDQAE